MNKLKQAAQQILEALEGIGFVSDYWNEKVTALRNALAEPELNLNCKSVQKRLATVWGYVKAEQAEQEPFDMNDHPPHRLCECRKCMEYFTPLPDCDAFAAFGKPIAEQTNTQFMEGYRIGLAEMREKCAKVVTEHVPTCSPNWVSYVVAIRAIKFEGDTGFRPVSEMIAEHKQDPKKAAAIEKAKMRKAEQKPVGVVEGSGEWGIAGVLVAGVPIGTKLYAAPVRTKDLTDEDKLALWKKWNMTAAQIDAAIAAYKEKNNVWHSPSSN